MIFVQRSKNPYDLGGNDGTDWWRANMNGQQLPVKPQPNTMWNHTPKNNTDFKQWGVEDHEESISRVVNHNAPNSYGAIGGNRQQKGGIQTNPSSNSTSACDSMWVSGLNPGVNQSKKHNEWSGVNSCGPWGDTHNNR